MQIWTTYVFICFLGKYVPCWFLTNGLLRHFFNNDFGIVSGADNTMLIFSQVARLQSEREMHPGEKRAIWAVYARTSRTTHFRKEETQNCSQKYVVDLVPVWFFCSFGLLANLLSWRVKYTPIYFFLMESVSQESDCKICARLKVWRINPQTFCADKKCGR